MTKKIKINEDARLTQVRENRMANMSYCRFENTVADLDDCYEDMDAKDLGDMEIKARKRLIDLCIDIACDYGHMNDRLVSED